MTILYTKDTFESHLGIDTVTITTVVNRNAFVARAQRLIPNLVISHSDRRIKFRYKNKLQFNLVDDILTIHGSLASHFNRENINLPDFDEWLTWAKELEEEWGINIESGRLESIHLAATCRMEQNPQTYIDYLRPVGHFKMGTSKNGRTKYFNAKGKTVTFYDKTEQRKRTIAPGDNILRYECRLSDSGAVSSQEHYERPNRVRFNLRDILVRDADLELQAKHVHVRDLREEAVRLALIQVAKNSFYQLAAMGLNRQKDLPQPVKKKEMEKYIVQYLASMSEEVKSHLLLVNERGKQAGMNDRAHRYFKQLIESAQPEDSLADLEHLQSVMEGVFNDAVNKCLSEAV
jgi:hypothetical protein